MLLRAAAHTIFILATLAACTKDTQEGQTEPVAPSEEQTPYPEDADLAKTDNSSSAQDDSSADAEAVGELTDDPFKGGTAPSEEAPTALAEDGLPEPDAGEPYDGAFDDKQPAAEPAPDMPVAGPDAADDVTTAPSEIVSDDTATEPSADVQASDEPRGKETRYVDAIMLNVRSQPNLKAEIVRRLLGGAKVYVQVKGGWAKIKRNQWVRTRYLSESPTRRVNRSEAQKAWQNSRYKDTWKPNK